MAKFSIYNIKKILIFIFLSINTFLFSISYAHEYRHNELLINHPYSTPTRPGTDNGVMYIVSIKNTSDMEDELIGVSTAIASLSEIHSMKKVNGIMKMRRISAIKLPPNETVSIKKGNNNGYHIMLFGLKNKLKHGDNFDAILHFKNTESLKVNVEIIKTNNTHKH